MKKKSIIILIIIAVLSVSAAIAFVVKKEEQSSPKYPEIKFGGTIIDVKVDASEKELLEGVIATDPEDGDVTDSLVIEGVSRIVEGTTMKVSYAAFDSMNHVTKKDRLVNFVDYEKPRFSMNAPMLFRSSKEIDFMSNVGAEDVFEGDISKRIKYSVISSSSTDGVDKYEVKFSVTNKIGDTVTLPLTIEVSGDYTNSAMITLSDYLVYVERDTDFFPKQYLVSYTSKGEQITSEKGFNKLDIINNVNTAVPGVYTVDYIESTSGSRTRLVVIVD